MVNHRLRPQTVVASLRAGVRLWAGGDAHRPGVIVTVTSVDPRICDLTCGDPTTCDLDAVKGSGATSEVPEPAYAP